MAGRRTLFRPLNRSSQSGSQFENIVRKAIRFGSSPIRARDLNLIICSFEVPRRFPPERTPWSNRVRRTTRRALLEKGDEGIKNLIPRRHNARVYYGSITR